MKTFRNIVSTAVFDAGGPILLIVMALPVVLLIVIAGLCVWGAVALIRHVMKKRKNASRGSETHTDSNPTP